MIGLSEKNQPGDDSSGKPGTVYKKNIFEIPLEMR
jgi:hypothetical protein